jgi:DNA polymerase (family X)
LILATARPKASRKAITNSELAEVFEEVADWLEVDDENPFRVRAYRNAARTIRACGEPLHARDTTSQPLTDLPGIGEDLAAKIDEILESGSCDLLQKLRKRHPRDLRKLIEIPGVGPKRVRRLFDALGIASVDQLRLAAEQGRIRLLKGFGPRSEASLLRAAIAYQNSVHRWSISSVMPIADSILEFMRGSDAVLDVVVAGSFRRRRDTVGDLDILVSSERAAQASSHFVGYPGTERILAHGTSRSSIVLENGLQVDLRVVKPESLGAALAYFTGSRSHTIALRRLAQRRHIKLNEYGAYREGHRIGGETEESIYASVGLPLIPPELREARGELEAAARGELPRLIEFADLRGDLHAHTRASDGLASLAEMAAAARDAGLSYLAITDHSTSLRVAHGMDARRLALQIEEIDRFNADSRDLTLLKGIEVEILEDGSLDLPDEVLARLDLVVAAVHSHFQLSRSRQTERILRAMGHRYFSILAHPTGRLIGRRSGYEVDLERIARFAAERGCCMELNAHPDRLDLDDLNCRMARDAGVSLAISSDAHDVNGFAALEFGISQARRAWLEKSDVINTLSPGGLRRKLAATMLSSRRSA